MDGKEMLQKYVVVEGHRDVYEQLYRTSIGEKSPIRDAIAPRLIRDGINLSVYAISGDSYSHSQNTGRYLETALDQIDQFLEEAPRSEGMIQMVKTRGDLPDKVEPGTVKFMLHFEGCMPLRGSIHNLRNFYRLGLALASTGVEFSQRARRRRMGKPHRRRPDQFRRRSHQRSESVRHDRRSIAYESRRILSDPRGCHRPAPRQPRQRLRHARQSAQSGDDQIKAIADQGGLVGILALPERVGKGEVGIEDMLKHMDYMINLVGIEHLALGMDFVKYDGPRTLKDRHHPLHKDPLIKGFEEIEDLPNLINGLQKHGYKEDGNRPDPRR